MPPTYYYYLHILIPFFTSYTFYNASRRSFADTSLKLLSDNTITEAQYARVNSITSTLYGVSKYVASIVLNYVSPKTTYLFGLLMSSIVVTAAGLTKPDLVAPGVNIQAPDVYGSFLPVTGTSFATPIVSGAAALLMEWGIVQGNDPFLYGEKIKAYLRKGARPLRGEMEYPNDRVGYGRLCVADSLPI